MFYKDYITDSNVWGICYITLLLQMYAMRDTMTTRHTTTPSPKDTANVNASSSRFSNPDNLLPYLLLSSPKLTATATDVCLAGVPESFATTTMCASFESFK